MGNNGSTAEERKAYKQNKKIETQNVRDHRTESNKIKLLLLGTGESGKSTLVKQMRNLYGKPLEITVEENRIQRFAVYSTVFNSMAALLKASDNFIPLADASLAQDKEYIIKKAGGMHGSFKEANLVNGDMKKKLMALWNDEGIRGTWEKHRSPIQAQESLEYFMEEADRIFDSNYKVTENDWLRTRVRTTGVLTEEFTVDKVKFNVWDVGGQRNERKKWIHCFSQVTSVIFVVAISEYDELLFEDTNVNRLIESLNLFDEMCNHPQFTETGMILFLNKSDLYDDKIGKIPIKYIDQEDPENSRWEDFDGPEWRPMEPKSDEWKDYRAAGIEYFTLKFCNLNQHPSTKEIYVHVTNAMDKRNVDVVFSACRDIILRQVLSEQGFVRD